MSSYIDFDDIENNKLLISSQSKIEFPRHKLSLFINDDFSEFVSLKKTLTTEIKPKYSQNDLLINEFDFSNGLFKEGFFRSVSLSKTSLIPGSPLLNFKKNSYIKNIKLMNKLANLKSLLSQNSSNINSKFSTKINILQLGLSSNERKLTSNQITSILKRKLGEGDKKNKNIFATQIIKQAFNKKNENQNHNNFQNQIEQNTNTVNNFSAVNILKSQTKSSVELENIKKQITQTAKCVYAEKFNDFYGFAAFTFKTNEEKYLDKIDIVLNKQIQSQSSANEICHCFGMFPYINENDDISSMLKDRYHKHLLHRKDFSSNTANAILDTFIHFDKKIHHYNNSNNNNSNIKTIPVPIFLSLVLFNDHIYITNNSSIKCITFNIENMNISTLSKNQFPTIIYKEDFSEKKQQSKSLCHTFSFKSAQSSKIHNSNLINYPIITELPLNNLHNQDQIDFIVIVNENISNVLSNKEIVLAILSSLSSNTLSYNRTLETAIDSICIEATKKQAKFPLSVLFLPMKGYYSIVTGNNTQQNINKIITKLKSTLNNEESLHNQCIVCKNNRKKTSEITAYQQFKCHSCTHDAIECKDNGEHSSFNSYSSSGNYDPSLNYKGVTKCKKAKKMFCGCFA